MPMLSALNLELSSSLNSWKMHSLRAEVVVKLKSAGKLFFGKKILKKE
jgi:hypothetical protein